MWIVQLLFCTNCNEHKCILEFSHNKTRATGRQPYCKFCVARRQSGNRLAQRRQKLKKDIIKANIRAVYRVLLEDPDMIDRIIARNHRKFITYRDEEIKRLKLRDAESEAKMNTKIPSLQEWARNLPRNQSGKWTKKALYQVKELA